MTKRNILGLLPDILQAGSEVRRIYSTDFSVTWKGEDDPLTQADLISNQIISDCLKSYYPGDFVLSEEEKEEAHRIQNHYIWLLDPIDGTREFVKKKPEFAISLGLAIHGVAISGIVYNPITDELVIADSEYGISSTVGNHTEVFWKQHLNNPPSSKPRCIVSHSEFSEGYFDDPFWSNNFEIQAIGSIAYKLALLAMGKFDLCISLRPKSDWDIGAGVALVNASGGDSLDLVEFQPMRFNEKSIKKQGIISGNPEFLNDFLKKNRSQIHKFYSDLQN
ncbi:MAG: 3'(2'),5'-bisphosphate nucleotidase CysQ [Leptospiraceae bacterium]|nr:3'(2'),5'-bisphosphate nucleotidase CysQ [Leptospiraceae bacterium]MCP5511965.1 3'(2'),5'-bisphosphate nucleotidase CysQ [Leptospiraceae bacterium]